MPFSTSDNFVNWGLEYAYSVGMSNQIATYVPMQDGGTVMGEDGEGGGLYQIILLHPQ